MSSTEIQGGTGERHARIKWLALLLVTFMLAGCVEIPSGWSCTNNIVGISVQSEVAHVPTHNRIAMIKPVFTATAYANAFYTFYRKYVEVPPGEYVTTDLNLLNRTVVNTWGWSENVETWFESDMARSLHLVLGETVSRLTEIDVDAGCLFENGTRLYDVVILGFTEYVTQKEYLSYKQFVASGGTLILLDACNFLAEVTYSNGYLSLTKGHGWEFNGTHAKKSDYHRWYDENKNWVGSNYWLFWRGNHYDKIVVNQTNVFSTFIRNTLSENINSGYGAHEENILQNMTGTNIIGYWNLINHTEYGGYPIAAYMHSYRGGTVLHSGIMASDVICSDWFVRVFLAASIRFGLTGNICNWLFPQPLVAPDDYVKSTIVLYQKYGGSISDVFWGMISCDINFNATKDVLRNLYRHNLQTVKGKVIEQGSADQQLHDDFPLESQKVNDTCWQMDISTYSFSNGDYTLLLNATWQGIRCSSIVIESVGTLNFSIENSWVMSSLPWVVPLSAMLFAAAIVFIYSKFARTKVG